MLKFAFAGFRHPHILALHKAAAARNDVQIVAACEEDAATRQTMGKDQPVQITHDSIDRMIAESGCDVLAIGDYYQKRGSIALRALEAGKHVISDKPLCTDISELAQMRKLAQEKKLSVGCQLDMRDTAPLQTLRRLIAEDALGEVHTVMFSGQHPVMLGSRPGWYFEAGKHGGTINDIAIHALDGIQWFAGRRITGVAAARVWNASCKKHPDFEDGAQLMLKLDNNGGVLGDVSYLAPTRSGYADERYWRFTIHGDKGVAETGYNFKHVTLINHDDEAPQQIPAQLTTQLTYLDDFIAEVAGQNVRQDGLTTNSILEVSELALKVQAAAK